MIEYYFAHQGAEPALIFIILMYYKSAFRIEQRPVGFEIHDWQQRQLLVALSSRTGKSISTRSAKNGSKINDD